VPSPQEHSPSKVSPCPSSQTITTGEKTSPVFFGDHPGNLGVTDIKNFGPERFSPAAHQPASFPQGAHLRRKRIAMLLR
jgi:hypothetical protein